MEYASSVAVEAQFMVALFVHKYSVTPLAPDHWSPL